MKIIIVTLLFLNFIFVSGSFGADKNSEEAPIIKKEKIQVIKYKKKTRIDFTELSIQGELKRPSGFLILKRKGVEFSGLINLRKDFDEKLYDSVNFIK